MISFPIILLILLIHWLADFGLQTHEQAMAKSTDSGALADHVGVYTLVWFIASYSMFDSFPKAVLFSIVTFICHFGTDYITSRVGKPFWDKKDYHNGFIVVGFDQILHYIQLFVCYLWLSKAL